MPRPSSSDTRYLEQNHGKWRVTIAVPRDLHGKLGTRLKRQLQTDSLAIANQLKWQVVSELKAEIDRARRGAGGAPSRTDILTREAIMLANERAKAQTDDDLDTLDYVVGLRADELRGDPVAVEPDHRGRPEYIYDPQRDAAAGHFRALAMGEATPIGLHHERFIASANLKARTKGDDYRAVKFLVAWCERNRVPATLEAITRKVAVRFTNDLPGDAGGQSATTLKKYLNRLSRYWQWLQAQEMVAVDVWSRIHRLLPAVAKGPEERSFTDAEVARLLTGRASQQMDDLMRLGALTGARLDVIVDLKVKDCADGLLTFKPQKKETKPRSVPIHPALVEIIERRCKGRSGEDDVFPEWPPSKGSSERERSFKASNAFTIYRRKVGVDEVIAGKRRSLVNFHSFRRWFITKAEQAGQPENIIAAVVGHKRKGMTLGRYSSGPLIAQARQCVEAVKLPDVHDERRDDRRVEAAHLL
ncbi:tyrosine-type recombinase/integrase [Methylobacterium nigriterrae]|uniref:tyrosine-type recombinase/integrase n=1 Tax=Methylobacterium nigriterrae TaxID=3127512 RepID=UPI0030137ED9